MSSQLKTPTADSNGLSFAWTAIPGRTYQPQYKAALDPADCLDLGNSIGATNNMATALDPALRIRSGCIGLF